MLFTLKKLISTFLFPLPFSLLMLVMAGLLWLFGKRKLSAWLAGIATGIVYLASLPIVSQVMINKLELQYPKYAGQRVEYVVVLGGSHLSSEHVPLSSLLSKTSLMRLTEGVMIYKANPGSKLLLSGYGGDDPITNARAMSLVAISMGVAEEDMVIEERPKDTDDEARLQSKIVKDAPFALVTSPSHIPRAMYLFKQQGTNPIAAPTNFSHGGLYSAHIRNFVPSGSGLNNFDIAWHEYLGLLWSYIRF